MKKYELVYIVHPDLEDTIDKVTEKVSGFVKKKGGKIISEENWGKRKLAYPIKKNSFGIYIVLNFEVETKDIQSIERLVLLSEEIIRHIVVAEDKGQKVGEARAERRRMEEKEGTTEKKSESKKAKKADLDIDLDEKKAEKKEEDKAEEKDEAERLKALDEKLGELLGDDKE